MENLISVLFLAHDVAHSAHLRLLITQREYVINLILGVL